MESIFIFLGGVAGFALIMGTIHYFFKRSEKAALDKLNQLSERLLQLR